MIKQTTSSNGHGEKSRGKSIPPIVRRPSSMLLFGSLILICGSLQAQVLNGRDTAEGVFVRDSALAVDRLALAQRMEHLKEWEKAAEVYQDIVKNFADRLVPSQVDSNNQICQYSSVTPLVQAQLARWPSEALAIYRARY